MLTVENEKEHAKSLFKLIQELRGENSNELKIEASVPLVLGNTLENLKAAIAGEN